MTDLAELADRIVTGGVQVLDRTSPLHAQTPILSLPPEMGQTARFELEEISRYDDRGPAWYWNNFRTGEHTGTHFDAPNHWVTGKDLDDVSRVPAQRLAGPAVVVDRTREVAADPDYLLDVADLDDWQAEHGPFPGALLAALPHRLGGAHCASAPTGPAARSAPGTTSSPATPSS